MLLPMYHINHYRTQKHTCLEGRSLVRSSRRNRHFVKEAAKHNNEPGVQERESIDGESESA